MLKQYRIRYSPNAQRDLDVIWSGVLDVSQDLDTAEQYVDDILKLIDDKGKLPKSGTRLFCYELFTGIYFIKFKAYLIFYRLSGTMMEVIRILPEKCDYVNVLMEDGIL